MIKAKRAAADRLFACVRLSHFSPLFPQAFLSRSNSSTTNLIP